MYLFGPLRRRNGRDSRPSVPILMYHSISRGEERGVHPYFRIRTAPETFVQQMQLLRDHGYRSVDLEQAVAILAGRMTPADKPVVLTFDDGFRDFYQEAFPVLERYGLTATVYLPTAYIGDSAPAFSGQQCLTWSQVRELHAHGIQFGSHTVTHPLLQSLPRAGVERELRDSKAILENQLSAPVTSFAYPYAFPQTNSDFRSFLRETLAACGYRNGVSTILGTAGAGDDVFFLRRLPVNSDDDPRFFRSKLDGGYDWLEKFQGSFKRVKRLVAPSAAQSGIQTAS